MEKVKVKKSELMEVLQKNRTEHRAIFEEAVKGYREAAIAKLDRALQAAKENKNFGLHFDLIRPEDHTRDYSRIIRMLEMSTDDLVELSQREFAQYVQDDWDWQRNWLHSNAAYAASATTKLNSMAFDFQE